MGLGSVLQFLCDHWILKACDTWERAAFNKALARSRQEAKERDERMRLEAERLNTTNQSGDFLVIESPTENRPLLIRWDADATGESIVR
jgi:hypothetical protein